jgi:hypothetical protein
MNTHANLFAIRLLALLLPVSVLGIAKSQAVEGDVAIFAASDIRLAARDENASETLGPSMEAEIAQGQRAPLTNHDPRLEVYLAMHCQALAGLPLRDSVGPYASSACGDVPSRSTRK